MIKRKLVIALVVMVAAASIGVFFAPTASAADARNYNPGRIIDDSIFTNSNSMSVSQIQSFLDSKMTNCDTNGTERAGGGSLSMTNRQWIEQKYGLSPPYRCLRDYRENPDNGSNNYGTNSTPAGAITAAQIIYNYSRQFNINPQALIVTLQKENGLITDNIPVPKNYREAMGFGCPDNRPAGAPACDPAYGSFSNQIYQAARHFRGYIDKPAGWYITFDTGWNDILWSPNQPHCGSSSVYIENRSTVALYTYTPYQPNQAAKNAQYGTGDGCSAYGNRNFYLYFTDWFGSTMGSFSQMQTPRYMQLKQAVKKINPATSSQIDDTIPAGTQIYFSGRIDSAYGTCLRTKYDTDRNYHKCIPLSSLDEITIVYSDTTPQESLQAAKQSIFKKNLRTDSSITAFPIEKAQIVSFPKKTTIAGVTYYISQNDATNGIESGIPASLLVPANTYTPITTYWRRLSTQVQKSTGTTPTPIDASLDTNLIIAFTSKTTTNGVDYYRTGHDTTKSLDKAIVSSALAEPFGAFSSPRWMKLNKTTTEIDPFTNQTGATLQSQSQVFVDSKLVLNGPAYFRAKEKTLLNSNVSIPAGSLSELEYINFLAPRWMNIASDSTVVDPVRNTQTSTVFTEGTQKKFYAKILVNGIWYFKDTAQQVIPADNVNEIQYSAFGTPRVMRVKTTAAKVVPSVGNIDSYVAANTLVKFVAKIGVNGVWYYQTEYDSVHGYNRAILSSDIAEL